MENNDIPQEHQDVLEENFGVNDNANNDEAVEGNPNNHPGDEIDHNPAAAQGPGPAAEPAAAPLPDEIDVMEHAIANVINHPPINDFHQLDNALQHVQGHMDNMMQNLGGLQSSVKHLKHNLNQFCMSQKSHENERTALRLSLHSDIVQSWRDGAFSDLTLVDDAGCHHKVHKVVLASRSSYFKAQLTNWDKDEKEIQVKIVTSDILKIIIEFIYTLDVGNQITNNNVVDLLQAANIYDLKLLREECVLFLKQRICASNIIEILSFSHIDLKLEIDATDFLSRNFSKFLQCPERKQELMEIPADKMRLILMSKLLILRDKNLFPVKAVPREAAILGFVLEYLRHRGQQQRLQHAAALLALVKFHLLPLDPGLEFAEDRWLPRCVTELLGPGGKLGAHPECVRMLTQTEADVRFLHTLADPAALYRHTHTNMHNLIRACDLSAKTLNERHTNWDSKRAREASICHEWWTAHAHDSRFIPSSTSSTVKIAAVSGSACSRKFIRKMTFYIGDVNENSDLLPEWFHLAPQYNMTNMTQELGEYIGALAVVWSDGTTNRLGDHGDLKRGVSVSLEEGEHVIKTYQLFWGPRQVLLPLEIVDFIFVTNKGRKFGPFTRQVTKLYQEADSPKKEWSFHDIRHKLNSKKIHRRVDHPLNPMCRPANITELNTANLERLEDDCTWASWLDGFLCIIKNRKITRITLKFAVYLDCHYKDLQDSHQKDKKSAPADSEPPVLYNYTLQDLRNNVTGKPIKIHDHDYLWDNMVTPLTTDGLDEEDKKKLKKLRKYDQPYVISLGEENFMLDHGPMPSSVQNVIHHILEPLPPPPDPAPQHPAVIEQQQAEVVLQALDDDIEALQALDGDQPEDEGNNNVEAEIENNLNEVNEIANEGHELVHAENNNNDGDNDSLDGDAPEQEHNIHDDVWDLDLRQINDLYKKKTLNVDDYLE